MPQPWPLVAAHRDRLLRIALRRCPTREDAEDVVSEALIRAATFEDLDESRLEQFLTAVTVRLCADLHRESARRGRAYVKLAGDPVTEDGPEESLVASVEHQVLGTAFATLPDRQRAVLADRAYGLSVPQIARRHALSYKAVESALSRARGALRAALASAMGATLVAARALRPRRVAVVAIPAVAALAVIATVLRGPLFGGTPSTEAAGSPPGIVPTTAANDTHHPADLAHRTGRTPPPRRTGAPVAAHHPAPPPRAEYDEYVVGDDPDIAQVKVKQKRGYDWVPELVQRCLEGPVWVWIDVDPSGKPPVSGAQGCGG